MPWTRLVDLKRIPNRSALERAAWAAGLTTLFVGGYFGLGLSTNPTRAHELTTQLDEQIPFIASSVWVYLWAFPCSLLPMFVVRCPRLFRRSAIAYAVVIAVALVFFAAYPVTSIGLRAAATTLDLSRPSDWAVSVVYSLDPPYNLFPSLHVAITALAAFSVRRAAKLCGTAILLSVAFVGVAACMIKQHFLLDVFGGFALATLADTLILRPYRPPDGAALAYSWHGQATYLAFTVFFYAGFYVAYHSSL
jgi:membrane-associated phospholipid phosphatase